MASSKVTSKTKGCFKRVTTEANHDDNEREVERKRNSGHTLRGVLQSRQQANQQPGTKQTRQQPKENNRGRNEVTATTKRQHGSEKSSTLPAWGGKGDKKERTSTLVERHTNTIPPSGRTQALPSGKPRTVVALPSDKLRLRPQAAKTKKAAGTHTTKPSSSCSTATSKQYSMDALKITITQAVEILQPQQTNSNAAAPPPPQLKKSSSDRSLALPDPDANDGDPFSCVEYVKDIYSNLLVFERLKVYTIRSGYLSQQSEVRPHHRKVVIDWLAQVHLRLSLFQETLYITVDILDRLLQTVDIPKALLQLAGVTSLLIASKYEDIFPPSVSELAYLTADTYTGDEVRKMERSILRALNYQINKPIALQFLRRYSKVSNAHYQLHNLVKYILELCFLSTKASVFLPSIRAAGAFLLAHTILTPRKTEQEIWSPVLQEQSQYSLADLQPVKETLKKILPDLHSHEKFTVFREKFSASQYHKVSTLPALEFIEKMPAHQTFGACAQTTQAAETSACPTAHPMTILC